MIFIRFLIPWWSIRLNRALSPGFRMQGRFKKPEGEGEGAQVSLLNQLSLTATVGPAQSVMNPR